MSTGSIRDTSPSGARRARAKPASQAASGADAASLDQLRRLLVGPEQTRLDRLEEQPGPSAQTVGNVLPEAVARTNEQRGEELSIALEPTVLRAVQAVAREKPDLFGEILAPTIGAAVRRSVSEALAAMLQRLDEVLERSLSLQSVRWRIEARRTKRPFAEVVLLRTLIYRVEQVFLIHPGTGLVLQHVVAAGVGIQDPDQVASMLEAIDSFVREAFQPQPSGVHLRHVQIGDLMIWIDRDASLAIAAVVRGVAPREFADRLREVRERIYLSHRAELASFRSDVSAFAAARPVLERCLQAQRRPAPRTGQCWLALAAVLACAALWTFVAHERAHATERAGLLRAYVATLEAEPGVVVITSAERADGPIRITGLRDPLAAPPVELLTRRGLPPVELHFESFYSLDPRVTERRAARALHPPAQVVLTLRDGVLYATGIAPRAWIERTRLLASALPGVERYDEHELHGAEAIAALRSAATDLERIELYFARGESAVAASSALRRAADHVWGVTKSAAAAGLGTCIAVLGHADAVGSPAENQQLSERRAFGVARALIARGVSSALLRPMGTGVRVDGLSAQRARSVTFRVDIGTRCPQAQ